MLKKLVLIAIAALAALLMLTGCGGTDEPLPEPAPAQEAVYEEEEPTEPDEPAPAPLDLNALPVNTLLDGTWDLLDAYFEIKTTPEVEGISGPIYSIILDNSRYTVVQHLFLPTDRLDIGMPYILLPHALDPASWMALMESEPIAFDWEPVSQTGGSLHRIEDTGHFTVTERTLIASASIDFISHTGRSWSFELNHAVSDDGVLDTFGITRPMATWMYFRLRY